jgi:hypothetical protein
MLSRPLSQKIVCHRTSHSIPSTLMSVAPGKQICKIGPSRPFQAGKKSCLVIGVSAVASRRSRAAAFSKHPLFTHSPLRIPSSIQDSVSIGYTPFVATELADICDVQHSPNSGDGGTPLRPPDAPRRSTLSTSPAFFIASRHPTPCFLGACETAYGLQCLDFFLTSSSGNNMTFDLVYFNFGERVS